MGRGLVDAQPELGELFSSASATLGFDLAQVCFEGPAEELTQSDRAQPGIFVVSVAAYKALQTRVPDLEVTAVAGLSSGEWAALYAADVVSYEDAIRVLEARGRFMQEACQESPGGMLSIIGLDRPALEEICSETGLEIANLNSPAQTVLSGPKEAVEPAVEKAKARGAKMAIPLPVAGAFHSSLMKPAAERFGNFLIDIPIQAPALPVLSNASGKPHGTPNEIRARMVEQITASVDWIANIEWIIGQGTTQFVECGPGKVLSGLIKRIDKQSIVHNIQEPSDLEAF
jgi:[acyl-carrier-protein] S-malonyltransferase